MNIKGLTEEEVEESRKKYGDNEIAQKKKNSFLRLLLESLGDPIIKILLIALAVKVVVLFKNFDWFETLGILIAIFLASFISSISEYGSEAAFERLGEEAAKIKVKVKRNGKIEEIEMKEVVKKDIVLLNTGDKIPADGYLLEGSLYVDESCINGEAKETEKTSVKTSTIEEKNKVYRGTIVYNGNATLLVTDVGENTIYGRLASELQEKEPTSPLKVRLRGLAGVISKIGYIGAILVVVSYLFSVIFIANNFDSVKIIATLTNKTIIMEHLLYALTLSVTIIIVAVPEGLPMMITLVLSSNMKRMLKNNVLVRRLVGIETAGSLNVLLTDKTGTLTKGKLEVTNFYSGNLKSYKTIESLKREKFYKKIYESLYYNNESMFDTNKEVVGGNTTDRALLKFVKTEEPKKYKVIDKVLFNSQNKYSYVEINNEEHLTYIKGAAEKIISKCTKYLDEEDRERILLNKKELEEKIAALTKSGTRVLVMAYAKHSLREEIKDLVLVGILAIRDELREEAKEGIHLIESAGIQMIMITGDHKDTAISIAKEAGLLKDREDIVLTSDELNALSDNEVKKIASKLRVVARALPKDKSRLVKILEEMDLVVGMTGDGVNDAPALKKANVGFAMGSGTEVCKEASDIVILDDNILSISKAILYGRTIFKSIRKFIIYQLTCNMCALLLSILGPFIGINTPITIIQMLWINMIMDTFAGLAFSFEPALKRYMFEPPKSKNEPIMNGYMYNQIIFTGSYSALLCILFLKLPIFKHIIRTSASYEFLMTAYFALFIFIGVCNAFNARTERLNLFANLKYNKVFIITISFIVLVQLYLIYHGGELFRTYGLTGKELFLVLLLASSVIPIDFLRKIMIKKKHYACSV